jgi:hypothetical protein
MGVGHFEANGPGDFEAARYDEINPCHINSHILGARSRGPNDLRGYQEMSLL